MNPIVRPTAILIEDGRILIVKQDVSERRHWSLPGGALEYGETIEQCMVREVKEETGIDVQVGELLYITDRFRGLKNHIVHMTFLVTRKGNGPLTDSYLHRDTDVDDKERTREVRLIPIDELPHYGFSETFHRLVKENFPGRGSYKGDFHVFYGEQQ